MKYQQKILEKSVENLQKNGLVSTKKNLKGSA